MLLWVPAGTPSEETAISGKMLIFFEVLLRHIQSNMMYYSGVCESLPRGVRGRMVSNNIEGSIHRRNIENRGGQKNKKRLFIHRFKLSWCTPTPNTCMQ